MKKSFNFLRNALAVILFIIAIPFAFVTAAFYFAIDIIKPN